MPDGFKSFIELAHSACGGCTRKVIFIIFSSKTFKHLIRLINLSERAIACDQQKTSQLLSAVSEHKQLQIIGQLISLHNVINENFPMEERVEPSDSEDTNIIDGVQ